MSKRKSFKFLTKRQTLSLKRKRRCKKNWVSFSKFKYFMIKYRSKLKTHTRRRRINVLRKIINTKLQLDYLKLKKPKFLALKQIYKKDWRIIAYLSTRKRQKRKKIIKRQTFIKHKHQQPKKILTIDDLQHIYTVERGLPPQVKNYYLIGKQLELTNDVTLAGPIPIAFQEFLNTNPQYLFIPEFTYNTKVTIEKNCNQYRKCSQNIISLSKKFMKKNELNQTTTNLTILAK